MKKKRRFSLLLFHSSLNWKLNSGNRGIWEIKARLCSTSMVELCLHTEITIQRHSQNNSMLVELMT